MIFRVMTLCLVFLAGAAKAQSDGSRFEMLNDIASGEVPRTDTENDFADQIVKFCGIGRLRIVPDLTGLDPTAARQQLLDCELEWVDTEPTRVISYESIGNVGSQEPKSGRIVFKGTKVAPFISAGLVSPNVSGKNVEDAKSSLEALQLPFRVVSQRHSSSPGNVFSQAPNSGEAFNFGMPFTLMVSEGPWVEVPPLGDIEYGNAALDLRNLDLQYVHAGGSLETGSKWQTICEQTVWYPVVDRVEPAAGTRIFPDDTASSPVKVFTRKKVEYIFHQPTGRICP